MPVRYAAAHVFFLPGISSDLLSKVQISRAKSHIKGPIRTAYIDFWPIESQIFTLDDTDSIPILYNDNFKSLVTKQIQRTAEQLASLCISLREFPVIRYFKPQDGEKFPPSQVPSMIASRLQLLLDDYLRANPDVNPEDPNGRARSVFLIVDRPIDQFAPLLHDFTFQALAYDLLPIKDGVKYDYEIEKPDGANETVTGVISDSDAEWVGLRHKHMTEVTELLSQKLEKLRRENPHLADSSTKASVRDLQNMVAALPGFMKTRDRFTLIVQMASESMRILEDKGLISLADIEQTCALQGVAADGRKSKTLASEFVAMLKDNPKLSRQDKVRLIIIYILYRGVGIIEQDLEKLIQHSGLDEHDERVIRNYSLLAAPIIKESLGKNHHLHVQVSSNQSLYKGNKSLDDGGKIKKNSGSYNTFYSHATDDVFSVSRYVPGIKNVTEKLIKGTLNTELFPYFKEPLLEEEVDLGQTSLRNPRQRAAWAKTSSFQTAKQRVFVFVAGGLTQGEARAAYELNQQFPREVIFGGNTILTPSKFLTALHNLSETRGNLSLELEKSYNMAAPSFLMESDREVARHQQANPAPSENVAKYHTGPQQSAVLKTSLQQPTGKTKDKEKKRNKKYVLF